MESIKAKLLELAATRTGTVKIDGLKFQVREVGSIEFGQYGEMQKENKTKAVALLISVCVVDDAGNPVLTADEAETLAKSARVSMPIIGKIMELSGLSGDDEKKADAG